MRPTTCRRRRSRSAAPPSWTRSATARVSWRSCYESGGDEAGRAAVMEHAIAEARQALDRDPFDVPRLRGLKQLLDSAWRDRRGREASQTVAQVLALLGAPPDDLAEVPPALRPVSSSLSTGFWSALIDPPALGFMTEVWLMLADAVIELHQPDVAALGAVRGNRVAPGERPRARLAGERGRGAGGPGPDPAPCARGQRRGRARRRAGDRAAGAGAGAGRADRRSTAERRRSRWAARSACCVSAPPRRRGSAAEALQAIFDAAAVIAGAPANVPGVARAPEAQIKALSRALARKERKTLALQASRFGFETIDAAAWQSSLLRGADRLGLVLGGDVRAAAIAAGRFTAPPSPPELRRNRRRDRAGAVCARRGLSGRAPRGRAGRGLTMAEREKPKAPVLPFTGEDENEWETELADWDAHLPIEDAPPTPGDPPLPEPDPLGALPDEENPFADTPTTVTSGPPLDDAAVFEASAAEFSERETPHSDAYAAIISSSTPEGTLFRRDPPSETPAPLFADPLIEMSADPWREKLQLMIRLPPRAAPAEPSDDERRGLLSLLAAEMEVADTATQQAALTLAAARLSDALGDTDAAVALCDDALTLQPGSAPALRARLRLAERQGDAAVALETVGLLAGAVDGDERAGYRALQAEWTLAMSGTLDEDARSALGDGLSRALAEAEITIRAGEPRQAAGTLEAAATVLEGRAGAALAGLAARLAEIGGDGAAATRQRALAARFAGSPRERLLVAVGQLRDAARAGGDALAPMLDELLATLPPGDFKVSCARWAAAVARRAGAVERADRLLSDPANGGTSPAALRDRLDLEWRAARGDGGNGERVARVRRLLAEAREIWTARTARACLDVMAAELALAEADAAKVSGGVGGGDAAASDAAARRALEIAAAGLESAPGTVPLAIVAQEVAGRAGDPALRLDALRLWARFDPARAAYAQSLVAGMLAQRADAGSSGGDEPVRQALGELVAAAPMATAFWELAARERAAGRKREAADALARGASAWSASELGPALQRLADGLRSDAPAPWPAAIAGRGKPRGADAPEDTLGDAPANPAALALLTLNAGSDPSRLATIYTNAAAAHGPGEKLWRLQAIHWLARAGRAADALDAARALHESDRAWAPGRALVERLVRVLPDVTERARALLSLGFDAGDAGAALRAAEASEDVGDVAGASRIFGQLAAGPLAAEAARGLVRLEGRAPQRESASGDGPDLPTDLPADVAADLVAKTDTAPASASVARDDAALDEPRARVRAFLAAAQAGRVREVVERLEREPPHQDAATAPGLYLAALLREAASDGDAAAAADSARLLALAAAGREAPRAGDRPGLLCAWRAAEATAGAPGPGGGDALAEVAERLLLGDDAEAEGRRPARHRGDASSGRSAIERGVAGARGRARRDRWRRRARRSPAAPGAGARSREPARAARASPGVDRARRAVRRSCAVRARGGRAQGPRRADPRAAACRRAGPRRADPGREPRGDAGGSGPDLRRGFGGNRDGNLGAGGGARVGADCGRGAGPTTARRARAARRSRGDRTAAADPGDRSRPRRRVRAVARSADRRRRAARDRRSARGAHRGRHQPVRGRGAALVARRVAGRTARRRRGGEDRAARDPREGAAARQGAGPARRSAVRRRRVRRGRGALPQARAGRAVARAPARDLPAHRTHLHAPRARREARGRRLQAGPAARGRQPRGAGRALGSAHRDRRDQERHRCHRTAGRAHARGRQARAVPDPARTALGAGGRSAAGGCALPARGRRRAPKSTGGRRDGAPLRSHARSPRAPRAARPRAAAAARGSARGQARRRAAARAGARHAVARPRVGRRRGRAAAGGGVVRRHRSRGGRGLGRAAGARPAGGGGRAPRRRRAALPGRPAVGRAQHLPHHRRAAGQGGERPQALRSCRAPTAWRAGRGRARSSTRSPSSWASRTSTST